MSDTLQICINALAHHHAGRWSDAEASYREALAAEPEFSPVRKRALNCLALLLLECRREDEAAVCWDEVLKAEPKDGPARVNLASALHACGRIGDSLAACDEALSSDPSSVEALAMRGRALIAAGRLDAAMANSRKAVAAHPASAVAHASLAIALLHARDPSGAVLAADAAVMLDPELAEGWFARGAASAALGSWKTAIDSLRHVIELQPNHASAQLNLANALADLDCRQESEVWLRRALDSDPRRAETHASLGALLSGDGRLIEAVHHCDEAVRLRPDFAEAHWNLAFAHLLAGDYAAGWRECEWRKRHPDFKHSFLPAPSGQEWGGEDIAGKILLVRAEQGIGDTIQFARFVPILAATGVKVLLACAAPAMALLAQLCPTTDRDAPLPVYDLWVDMMSLPGLLGVAAGDIPSGRGYLRAPPFKRRPRVSKPHVGIVCAGNPAHANDRRRSMPAAALAPIMELAGFVFTGLQAGPRGEELALLYGLADRSGELTDFTATARILAEQDLVVTVDTAVAHLAGAMGRPTFLMLPYAPDWRWMTSRGDSPWYESVTVFRQTNPGNWSSVTERIAVEMTRRFAKRA